MILIGSKALSFRSPQILFREPKDFDFICTQDELNIWIEKNLKKINYTKIYPLHNKVIIEGDVNYEFEIIKNNTSSELLNDLVLKDKDTINTSFGLIPNLDILFTLKSSHKYLKNSLYFWKTLADYHKMKFVGAKVREEYKDFLKLREKETYLKQKHPKLNQNKKNFFAEDSVVYKYDHDSIHQSIKQFEKPAYQYFSINNQEVLSSKSKFLSCTHEIQLASVVEESAVLAIERSLVPFPDVMTEQNAWRYALSKICTSISSGWWREWAYDNVPDIVKLYPEGYFNKFKEGLLNGIVKPFSRAEENESLR